MPDDAKKILSNLENGKLPDIKTGSGNKNKDLSRVRYNKSIRQDGSMPILESYGYCSAPKSKECKRQDSHSGGGIATKEHKKINSEDE